jgi:L-threonylcarbamoyladenylate synthase
MSAKIISVKDPEAVKAALSVLRRGGVIAYPTETAYGLGADATKKAAVKRIYRIKRRPASKLLSVIIGDLRTAKKYAVVDKRTQQIVRAFMPGPLTLVCEIRPSPLKRAMPRTELAWRIPSHWFALELVEKYGKPITATSANISGNKPNYRIKEIEKIFGKKVDLIVDGGNLPKKAVSTIFDVKKNTIIRKGPVSKQKILSKARG